MSNWWNFFFFSFFVSCWCLLGFVLEKRNGMNGDNRQEMREGPRLWKVSEYNGYACLLKHQHLHLISHRSLLLLFFFCFFWGNNISHKSLRFRFCFLNTFASFFIFVFSITLLQAFLTARPLPFCFLV